MFLTGAGRWFELGRGSHVGTSYARSDFLFHKKSVTRSTACPLAVPGSRWYAGAHCGSPTAPPLAILSRFSLSRRIALYRCANPCSLYPPPAALAGVALHPPLAAVENVAFSAKGHACSGYALVNAGITPTLRYQPFAGAALLARLFYVSVLFSL